MGDLMMPVSVVRELSDHHCSYDCLNPQQTSSLLLHLTCVGIFVNLMLSFPELSRDNKARWESRSKNILYKHLSWLQGLFWSAASQFFSTYDIFFLSGFNSATSQLLVQQHRDFVCCHMRKPADICWHANIKVSDVQMIYSQTHP